MRLQIARSWDFNQMLVASVFGHLLLVTFVISLPKSTYEEIVITPAFVVELVDLSNNGKKAVQKPFKKSKPQKKIIPEKSIPEPKDKPKPVLTKPIASSEIIKPIQQTVKLEPKHIAQKASPDSSKKILKNLNQLNRKYSGRLVQELDKLAKLVPTVSIKKPVIKKSQPILEKTFDELNALKNKRAEYKQKSVEPPPFPASAAENKIESSLRELEFASLSPNTVELEKKKDEKSAADLLQELTKMESQPSDNNEPPETQKKEIVVPTIAQEESQAFESILKKFEFLNKIKPKDINTERVANKSFTEEFQSDIRKVSVPKQVTVEVVASSSEAYVQSPNQGKPSADVLAQYIGIIKERVYKNWKTPLGQNHDKEVVFSFYIYPQGNIDRPELKKSSGIELLDNLARRAILESEPFPPFPKEIKSSNLNVSIKLKYIPEKN